MEANPRAAFRMGVLLGAVISLIACVIGGGVLAVHFAKRLNEMSSRLTKMEAQMTQVHNAVASISTRMTFSGSKGAKGGDTNLGGLTEQDISRVMNSPLIQEMLSAALSHIAATNAAAGLTPQEQKQMQELMRQLRPGLQGQ